MSEADDFDALLKQRFDREHQQVPADPFVATTLQRIRRDHRQKEGVHMALRAVAVLAAIIASPWLIAGATRLNTALEATLSWTAGLPGAWVVAVLVVAAVLVSRVRGH
jgi:hypothetical protein